MKTFRLSIAIKIFLFTTAALFTVAAVGCFMLYTGSMRSLRRVIKENLKSTALIASNQIDPQLLNTIKTRTDEKGYAYKTIKQQLSGIKKSNNLIHFIYTMRKTAKPGILEFVVDAETNPKLISHIGDKYNAAKTPEMIDGFKHPSTDKDIKLDYWGKFLSSYSPVKDKNNNVVGIVGVDMSQRQIENVEFGMKKAEIKTLIVTFILSCLLSLVLTKMIVKHINIFKDAANRASKGDLDFQIKLPYKDEIGDLAIAFNCMLRELKGGSCDLKTGLLTHVAFKERLDTELTKASYKNTDVCLIIIDINGFTNINETYGYYAGDSIISQFGSIIKEHSRKDDIAARYSGDQFAIIIADADEIKGHFIASRLKEKIESYRFSTDRLSDNIISTSNDTGIFLKVSIGLAVYPKDHQTRDGLIMTADIALSSAKSGNNNSIYAFDVANYGEDSPDPEDIYTLLNDPNAAAIRSLAEAVDAKDKYTRGHSDRVSTYSVMIGEGLGLSNKEIESLKVAGLLHDIGKIGIPDNVLNKVGRLSDEERVIINQHPAIGSSILSKAPSLEYVVAPILYHHERLDGSGYPEGLKGDSVPLFAQIIAVADSYDAMTSNRPYRTAMAPHDAANELQKCSKTHYNSEMVDILISTLKIQNPKAA